MWMALKGRWSGASRILNGKRRDAQQGRQTFGNIRVVIESTEPFRSLSGRKNRKGKCRMAGGGPLQAGFVGEDMGDGYGQRVGAAILEIIHVACTVKVIAAGRPSCVTDPSEAS